MSSESTVRSIRSGDLALIETLRWEPREGFLRLDRHIRRLRHSAHALGFRQPDNLLGAITYAVGGDVPLRVRLTATVHGEVDVTTTPFIEVSEGDVWRLRIAPQRLACDNPFLRHKTTKREVHDAARLHFRQDEADEVVLLNERGEVCEGSITNLFVKDADGILLTPALSCGLLPGILRAELIREGKARSQVLTVSDLSIGELYVGNALRGLIPAKLLSTN